MSQRYIYNEKQKSNKSTTGYGTIIDTKPDKTWDNEIATIYGNKKAILVLDALNLKNDLSNLKKGSTKADIISLLKKHNINL